ncbi:unnamed protein product [Linum tenue]|uniref:Methyltransferase type 11 domain-containing protein n=1 Tax=Linum tenue TaxID=586396 RepID=A0AAV0S5V4_9ROSI|nr:unnamed protein product [Linum tenue]
MLASLFLSLPLFLFLLFPLQKNPSTAAATATFLRRPQPPPGIRIRPGYTSYETYIQRQLNKTQNPKLRRIWRTRDWDRKVVVFSRFFRALPPLVVKGDFHAQPFGDATFDFEFSNVFDHALYPDRFVGEIERTLKPGGVCALHVAVSRRPDKYSANDLLSVAPLVNMFRGSEVVYTRKVDGFGLDTEIVFRKKNTATATESVAKGLR